MKKVVTAYTLRHKKTGEFLSNGGSRNVKNLAAARLWATEAGAQGWLDTNINQKPYSGDSYWTREYMKEHGKFMEVVPVKMRVAE